MITDIQKLVIDLKLAGASSFQMIEYGYLGEINNIRGLGLTDSIMYLLPPQSTMPDIYKNDEEHTCVFHCYTRFATIGGVAGTNANDRLEYLHDALKEKFLRTINGLTINNEHKYIVSGGLGLERTSREFNQEYVGLIATVNIRQFSTCLDYSIIDGIGSDAE